jgi:hypothetical protein
LAVTQALVENDARRRPPQGLDKAGGDETGRGDDDVAGQQRPQRAIAVEHRHHRAAVAGFTDVDDGVVDEGRQGQVFRQRGDEGAVALGPRDHRALGDTGATAGAEVEEAGPGAGLVEVDAVVVADGVVAQPVQVRRREALLQQELAKTHAVERQQVGVARGAGPRQGEGGMAGGVDEGAVRVDEGLEAAQVAFVPGVEGGVGREALVEGAVDEEALVGLATAEALVDDGMPQRIAALDGAQLVEHADGEGVVVERGRDVVGAPWKACHRALAVAGRAAEPVVELDELHALEAGRPQSPHGGEPGHAATDDDRIKDRRIRRHRRRRKRPRPVQLAQPMPQRHAGIDEFAVGHGVVDAGRRCRQRQRRQPHRRQCRRAEQGREEVPSTRPEVRVGGHVSAGPGWPRPRRGARGSGCRAGSRPPPPAPCRAETHRARRARRR